MTTSQPLARLAALALLSFGLVATGFAQSQAPAKKPESTASEKPKQDETEKPRPPISLFGDPQRFSRLGGWGGMGSTMAQFGLSKAMLVMMPGVQKELKITDEQREKLKEWSETFRQKGEGLAKSAGIMPGGPGGAGGGGRGGLGGGEGQGGGAPDQANIGAQIFKMMNFMTTLNGFFKEAEDAANKILTRSQRIRLNQIALQMEGLSALSRPEVAEALNMDPQRYQAIQEILNDARTGQTRYWIGQMTQMALTQRNFRRPGGQGRPEGEARPADTQRPEPTPSKTEVAKTDKNQDKSKDSSKDQAKDQTKTEEERAKDDAAAAAEAEKQQAAREARRVEMRKRFENMQQGSDQIQNLATIQILKLLSKKQRATFDRMLGEPFDPNALIPRPEDPSQLDRNAKAAEKAKATPRKSANGETPKAPPSLRERRFGKAAAGSGA